jgi:hypothetical protein
VLERIFWLKREEVVGGWTRLQNEQLHNLYLPPNIISVIKSRRLRRTAHVVRMGVKRNVTKILVGKHDGKSPYRRLGHKWEGNIRMTRKIQCELVDWIHLAQNRNK